MQKCLDQDLRVADLHLHELSTNGDFLGRFLMYGDIYCTDFTCTSYTFTSFAWFLVTACGESNKSTMARHSSEIGKVGTIYPIHEVPTGKSLPPFDR